MERRLAGFGAFERFRVTVLRRRGLTGSRPSLDLLIALPPRRLTSQFSRLAHWKCGWALYEVAPRGRAPVRGSRRRRARPRCAARARALSPHNRHPEWQNGEIAARTRGRQPGAKPLSAVSPIRQLSGLADRRVGGGEGLEAHQIGHSRSAPGSVRQAKTRFRALHRSSSIRWVAEMPSRRSVSARFNFSNVCTCSGSR
jgi:hypothetical protein